MSKVYVKSIDYNSAVELAEAIIALHAEGHEVILEESFKLPTEPYKQPIYPTPNWPGLIGDRTWPYPITYTSSLEKADPNQFRLFNEHDNV